MGISLTDRISQAETVDDIRGHLQAIRSPTLDSLRASIKTIPTSGLISTMCMGMTGNLLLVPEEMALPPDKLQELGAAIMMELSDEIDRRMPIPK